MKQYVWDISINTYVLHILLYKKLKLTEQQLSLMDFIWLSQIVALETSNAKSEVFFLHQISQFQLLSSILSCEDKNHTFGEASAEDFPTGLTDKMVNFLRRERIFAIVFAYALQNN